MTVIASPAVAVLAYDVLLAAHTRLFFDGNPDFHTSHTSHGIEGFRVSFEARSFDMLKTRLRKPLVPDRIDRLGDGRHVFMVHEHGISMRCNSSSAEIGR